MVLLLFIIMVTILLIVFFRCDDIDIKIGVITLFSLIFLLTLGVSYGCRNEGFSDVEEEYYALIALADNKDYYEKYKVEVNNRIEKYNKKIEWERKNQDNWFWNDFVNDDIVEYLDTIEIKGGEQVCASRLSVCSSCRKKCDSWNIAIAFGCHIGDAAAFKINTFLFVGIHFIAAIWQF